MCIWYKYVYMMCMSKYLVVHSIFLISPPPLLLCTFFCPLFPDIAVGAPYADNGNNNQGSVYVYYGRADIAEFAQQIPFEV